MLYAAVTFPRARTTSTTTNSTHTPRRFFVFTFLRFYVFTLLRFYVVMFLRLDVWTFLRLYYCVTRNNRHFWNTTEHFFSVLLQPLPRNLCDTSYIYFSPFYREHGYNDITDTTVVQQKQKQNATETKTFNENKNKNKKHNASNINVPSQTVLITPPNARVEVGHCPQTNVEKLPISIGSTINRGGSDPRRPPLSLRPPPPLESVYIHVVPPV